MLPDIVPQNMVQILDFPNPSTSPSVDIKQFNISINLIKLTKTLYYYTVYIIKLLYSSKPPSILDVLSYIHVHASGRKPKSFLARAINNNYSFTLFK